MNERKRFGKQYGYEVLFKGQDRKASGKAGVIIAESGLPEVYEYGFYERFMKHVFHYTLPPFIAPLVLRDSGKGLVDPGNALAREDFRPARLVDAQGGEHNAEGRPYVECECSWVGPNRKNPWDHGYFLYRGDGPSGSPDVCDKVGAKVVGLYYGSLIPEKKVAWRSQLRKVYDDAVAALSRRFPGAEYRNAYYLDRESMRRAVEELIGAGCTTIIYQSINCPLYSDFEDYGLALPLVHELVGGRAKVIMADQLGSKRAMGESYIAMLRDRLAELPANASVLVILSKHGHPFKKETQDERASLYRAPLEAGVRELMASWKGKWDLLWSCDEYADGFWDKKRTKFETRAAYALAVEEGYDFAIELPTEFPAENTDLMIFHAMKKFADFPDYAKQDPVPYPDWERPLVRRFRKGRTTAIYAGTPVGPYRSHVTQALVESVAEVLA